MTRPLRIHIKPNRMCAPTWTSSQLYTSKRFANLNLDFEFEIHCKSSEDKKQKKVSKELAPKTENAES